VPKPRADDASAPPAHLRVLGTVTLATSAGPISIGRTGSRAVLAVLAAHPRGRSFEEMAAVIHPNADPDSGVNRVRTDLNAVRSLLRDATGIEGRGKFLRGIAKDHPSAAKGAKVVLGQMFALAVRHGAIPTNPVHATGRLRKPRRKIVVLTDEHLQAVRVAIRTWQQPVPGKPGPRHTGDLADIVDLMLATGARIGEILALRWEDLDLAATCPTLTICGTLVQVKGNGVFRQAWTKSDAGYRMIVLPRFAVGMLLARKLGAADNPHDAIFAVAVPRRAPTRQESTRDQVGSQRPRLTTSQDPVRKRVTAALGGENSKPGCCAFVVLPRHDSAAYRHRTEDGVPPQDERRAGARQDGHPHDPIQLGEEGRVGLLHLTQCGAVAAEQGDAGRFGLGDLG
jgi:integrase